MNPIVKSLLEFNQAFEIPRLESPGLGPDELIELRIKLLMEEVQEYAEAARAGDLVEVLDALADIGYILAGTIINHGMQDIYDDAFNEVHRSRSAAFQFRGAHAAFGIGRKRLISWQRPTAGCFYSDKFQYSEY